MALDPVPKPSNAVYTARVRVEPRGSGDVVKWPDDVPIIHRFANVEIRWRENPDRVSIHLKDGGDAAIRRFFSDPEKDVILEIEAR
jgi:hypothetical protein